MRKYLKIISIILIVTALIGAGYYLWQKLNLAEVLFGPEEKVITEPAKNLKAVSTGPIFDYWINKKNNSVYYMTPVGQVLKIEGGKEELVNSQILNRLHSLASSYDGTYAVAEFNYPTQPTFSIFNTATNGWQPLPAGTLAASWAPHTSELMYLTEKELLVFNPTNQKSRAVIPLTQKGMLIDWVAPEKALLYSSAPSLEYPTTLWSLNLSNKILTPLIREESGLTLRWSPDGELAIKFSNQNRVPTTSLIDKNNTRLATFSFQTLPSKCAWQSQTLYCAVPKNFREGLRLPDDYFKKAVFFEDGIYAVDLSNASTKILLEDPEIIIDAEHLEVASSQLYFKNRLDEKLYSLVIQ